MAATLTTLDALLKIVYLPGLPSWVNDQRPIWKRLERITKKERFKGRNFTFAAKTANSQSGGGIAESEVLPVGGNSTIVNMTMTMKYHYQVARMSAQMMDAASSDVGGFADSVKTELNSARDQMVEDLAIHTMFGDGYGSLGEVGAYSGTTLTMKTQATVGQWGTRALRATMVVQSWTAKTGGALSAAHNTISAIPTTTTATVVGSAGYVANDFVFRSITTGVDPRDKVVMGLGGIIDDGTKRGTFQGLSRTTYPQLKANKLGNSGTLRAWTPELMDELAQEAWLNGGGKYPTAFYSPLEIQRRAAAYIRADRTFDMSVKTLDGGYRGVEWTTPSGTVPWFVDRYCVPNTVFAPHEPDLFRGIQQDVGMVDDDGRIWRYTDRTDTLEAWLRTWQNMGARQCNNSSYLEDISHTL